MLQRLTLDVVVKEAMERFAPTDVAVLGLVGAALDLVAVVLDLVSMVVGLDVKVVVVGLDRIWLDMKGGRVLRGAIIPRSALCMFANRPLEFRGGSEKYCGMIRANKGRMAGMQAQMMPTFTSTTDKVAWSVLSNDTLFELEMLSKV